MGPGGRLWACLADGERWRVGEWSPGASGLGRWQGGRHLDEPASALAWVDAGQTLYIAAAASGTLYSAAGVRHAPGPLRRLATVPQGSGRLGGLALDGRGGVCSAPNGGWSAVRFDADGGLDRVVALPVPCPTDLGFGGPQRRTLYITSARDAVSRESLDAAPLSGRLFAVDPVDHCRWPAALACPG